MSQILKIFVYDVELWRERRGVQQGLSTDVD